jgi:hypothetical protein
MTEVATRYPFSLARRAPVDQVVDTLDEHGIAVMDGYLEGPALARLVDECPRAFDDPAPWLHREDYSVGKSVRMERADVEAARYPELTATFGAPYLEDVTRAFFGDGYIFARTIYVILDVVGSSTHVQQLHYDKMRHLKTFFYLSRVDLEHGPFHCVPGSHRDCAQLQEANRARRIAPSDADVRVLPADYKSRTIPVLGSAGTLILFDSDIAHHAGVPTGGGRLAARSLSFGSYRRDTWYRADGTVEQI